MGVMSEQIRDNNNQFWTTARQLHLDGFMETSYQCDRKRRLIERWLDRADAKLVVIKQRDFESDPLLIEMTATGYNVEILGRGREIMPDVEIIATHLAIIAYSTDPGKCLLAWLRGEIKLPGLVRKPRDHYYAAQVFLTGA